MCVQNCLRYKSFGKIIRWSFFVLTRNIRISLFLFLDLTQNDKRNFSFKFWSQSALMKCAHHTIFPKHLICIFFIVLKNFALKESEKVTRRSRVLYNISKICPWVEETLKRRKIFHVFFCYHIFFSPPAFLQTGTSHKQDSIEKENN